MAHSLQSPIAEIYQSRMGYRECPAQISRIDRLTQVCSPTYFEVHNSLILSQHDSPTKEAVAARKHLLDSFAQYDRLAKKIRSLPCPTGFGNSQDRVQLAIVMRANIFLQKNMITLQVRSPGSPLLMSWPNHLQSIPTLRSDRGASSNSKPAGTDVSNSTSDEDAVAHALQPLLEQESLLEVFIEEAQSQRKFEDVKTLKTNLKEIRQEIEKLLDTSDT